MTTVKLKIAELRKEKGVGQQDWAEVLGVSFQAVSKWETGATMPDITLLPTIAEYFNVSVDELLGLEALCQQMYIPRNTNNIQFIEEFLKQVKKHQDLPFVKHHIEKYNGRFPIWVAIELCTFGMLSKLFSIMKSEDRKNIAKIFSNCKSEFLKSWFPSIVYLRNRCAHHSRLYFHLLTVTPRLMREFPIMRSNRIFDILYIQKFLFLDVNKWNDSFLTSLEALIHEYSDAIDLSFIGFPKEWASLLKIIPESKTTPSILTSLYSKEAAPATENSEGIKLQVTPCPQPFKAPVVMPS